MNLDVKCISVNEIVNLFYIFSITRKFYSEFHNSVIVNIRKYVCIKILNQKDPRSRLIQLC
jgi:hypothetical protein